jgi:hypothetical protein
MRKNIFQSLIFALIILGCSNNEDIKSGSFESTAYKIDLSEQGLSASKQPMLSLLAENIEYIPLETTKESLVNGNHQVYVSAKYIYTIAFRQILQFDRRDGTFIKELGQYGQGPDEYIATLPSVPSFDVDKPLVLTAKHIKAIDAETNGLETVAQQVLSAQGVAMLDTGTFVSFLPNFACNEKDRLVVYTKDGVEIKRYPNRLTCQLKVKGIISFDLSEGQFYYNDRNVFFKEVYNDTIFKVGKEQLEKHAYFT